LNFVDRAVRTAVGVSYLAPTVAPRNDLKAELERLKAENEALKSQRGRGTGLKVREKGGVSVYGLGRFPGRPEPAPLHTTALVVSYREVRCAEKCLVRTCAATF